LGGLGDVERGGGYPVQREKRNGKNEGGQEKTKSDSYLSVLLHV